MCKVSVVMTTYNGERFLAEQMQSLLKQTRLPDEVIICDDCSKDGTVETVRRFIETRGLSNWYFFENAENCGYVKNFREAMGRAGGDIMFLCDQDDVWEPDKIEKMAGAMEADPAILAMACGYRLIDGEGKPLVSDTKKFYSASGRDTEGGVSPVRSGKTLYYNIAQGCACAYRRELVEQYRAAQGGQQMPHDWALNLLAYQQQGLYYLNRELLRYRIHGKNQAGVSDARKKISNRIPNLLDYARIMEDAAGLPVAEDIAGEIRLLAEFTHVRVQWLRERKLSLWLKGFFRYFPTVRGYFFKEYLKDLALVLLKKLPGE